jgi:hypothetical protein
MLWPWLPPSRGDILAIVLGVALLAAVAYALFFRPWNAAAPSNAGFGPEWVCTPQPMGGPTCIKRPQANTGASH